MKVKLTFNLPDERVEYVDSVHAWEYKVTLQDLDEYLRQRLKYGELDDATDKAYETVRDELWRLARENKCADLLND